MRKLMVAFDGSEHALRALHYAISLARENGRISIYAVVAHEEPVVYGEIEVYVSRDKMAELQRRSSGAVLDAASHVLREAGVPYTTEILIGNIGEVIARRASDLACDGIVMGTHGRTAVGNLFMGSVATRVVHSAKVPVTLVK